MFNKIDSAREYHKLNLKFLMLCLCFGNGIKEPEILSSFILDKKSLNFKYHSHVWLVVRSEM